MFDIVQNKYKINSKLLHSCTKYFEKNQTRGGYSEFIKKAVMDSLKQKT